MSSTEKLQYVRAGISEIDRFAGLFARAFHVPQAGYFKWKYLDNPAGPAVAYEARDGDAAVGFYGAIPEVWTVRGKPMTLFQSMDTMVDPEYRGRGLFVDLAKLTMKEISEEHSGFMIGFPGHTSIGGFVRRLGWKDIAHVRILFSLRRFLDLIASLKKRAAFDLERVLRAGPEFDEYWSRRATRPLEIQKQYSAEFLNWRIFDCPGNRSQVHYVRVNARIAGVVVHWADSESTRVQMCDFLTEDLYAAYMAPAIAALARASNSTWIEMYEPNLPWARRVLRRAGTFINPTGHGRFSHHPPFIVWIGDPSRVEAEAYDYSVYDMHSLVLDF